MSSKNDNQIRPYERRSRKRKATMRIPHEIKGVALKNRKNCFFIPSTDNNVAGIQFDTVKIDNGCSSMLLPFPCHDQHKLSQINSFDNRDYNWEIQIPETTRGGAAHSPTLVIHEKNFHIMGNVVLANRFLTHIPFLRFHLGRDSCVELIKNSRQLQDTDKNKLIMYLYQIRETDNAIVGRERRHVILGQTVLSEFNCFQCDRMFILTARFYLINKSDLKMIENEMKYVDSFDDEGDEDHDGGYVHLDYNFDTDIDIDSDDEVAEDYEDGDAYRKTKYRRRVYKDEDFGRMQCSPLRSPSLMSNHHSKVARPGGTPPWSPPNSPPYSPPMTPTPAYKPLSPQYRPSSLRLSSLRHSRDRPHSPGSTPPYRPRSPSPSPSPQYRPSSPRLSSLRHSRDRPFSPGNTPPYRPRSPSPSPGTPPHVRQAYDARNCGYDIRPHLRQEMADFAAASEPYSDGSSGTPPHVRERERKHLPRSPPMTPPHLYEWVTSRLPSSAPYGPPPHIIRQNVRSRAASLHDSHGTTQHCGDSDDSSEYTYYDPCSPKYCGDSDGSSEYTEYVPRSPKYDPLAPFNSKDHLEKNKFDGINGTSFKDRLIRGRKANPLASPMGADETE